MPADAVVLSNGDRLAERSSRSSILFLFDMDGTLTPSRQKMAPEVGSFLQKLKQSVTVGIVSGSNFDKIAEQLSSVNPDDLYRVTDYVFAENGTVARLNNAVVGTDASIKDYLGEDVLQSLINFVLHYIADLTLPVKRGTFIEFRTGMLNISPVGRNCSMEERMAFFAYDKQHRVRERFVDVLQTHFGSLGLEFSIGGQISIDCTPVGWDKRYCLKHLPHFKEIHFFGDKTDVGGNDHTIFTDPRTLGHSVQSPGDTIDQVQKLLRELQSRN